MAVPLAKPTGITLPQHTTNVVTQMYHYFSTQPFIVKKLHEIFPELNVVNESFKNGLIHDEGKKAKPWQDACQADYKLYLENKPLHHIMTANYRHEFKTILSYMDDMSDDQFIANGCHHGKFRLIEKNKNHILRVENISNLKDSRILKRISLINNRLMKMSDEERIKWVYRYNSQRAILQFCDRKASYLEVPDNAKYYKDLLFNKFSYEFPKTWQKRKIQELAENNWEGNDLLIIKAKTGGGKTDAGLLWAKKIIEAELADRLIIAMPTIFTTNSIDKSIRSETNTESRAYNSSTKNLKNNIVNKQEKDFFSFDLYQRRTFQYPLTCCTIDTLLNALAQKSEDAHSTLFNMGNSCVVIDEFDFYDDLVMVNIKVLLKYLFHLNVKVLLMSATIPTSFRKFFKDISPDYRVSPVIIDDTYDYVDRYNINSVTRYNVDRTSTIKKDVLKRIDNSQKTIFYCNTQKSALHKYHYFQEKYPGKVLIYTSYFDAEEKMIKEKRILDDFGKNPYTNDYKIIIMSQIGELSLNITCDYMVTELCPIDRLVQRLGRIGRFDDPNNPIIRDVDVLIPQKNGSDYCAPYGELSEKVGWIESDVYTNTKKQLKSGIYSNDKLQKIIEKVYEKGVILEGDVKSNVKKYEEIIKTNSLLLPTVITSDDEMNETNTTQWKRRRFLPKVNLYLNPFETNEVTHSDFNYISSRQVVEVHAYQLRQLVEHGFVEEQTIKIVDGYEDRDMKIYYISHPRLYSKEYGLNLLLLD